MEALVLFQVPVMPSKGFNHSECLQEKRKGFLKTVALTTSQVSVVAFCLHVKDLDASKGMEGFIPADCPVERGESLPLNLSVVSPETF